MSAIADPYPPTYLFSKMPPLGFEAVLLKIGVSLGLGLLVGLQRERTQARVAGFRTFPLVTLLGTLCGLLGQSFGGWIVAVGLLAVVAIIILGVIAEIKSGANDPGMTTEAAMLVMYAIGAYMVIGHMPIAIVAGSAVAVLLFLKPQLHAFAHAIGDRDFRAIMQFVVISLVILPVLPNRYYGPYQVLNPFHIWVMVVFIVGISLTGYVLYKIWGHRAGTLVSGLLGGLISSTATTASQARRVRETPGFKAAAALVITIASTVVFIRVLLVISVRGPSFLKSAGLPIGMMLAMLVVVSVISWMLTEKQPGEMTEPKNPCELVPAMVFGAAYAIVLIAIAAAKEHLGPQGLYYVAVLSGLTDMDAITLSITDLVTTGKLDPSVGWRAILAASLSNIVFKTGIAGMLGGWRLLVRMALVFSAVCAAGIAIFLFWPG